MKLNVIKQRSLWWTFSVGIILIGFISMGISLTQVGAPLRPSLDFIGGTRLQFELDCTVAGNCDRPIDESSVREVMARQNLGGSSIQVLGEEKRALSIRTSKLDVQERKELENALSAEIGTFDPQKNQIDTVGPTIGRQLLAQGLLSLIVALFGIIAYLSIRFQFDYAIFAIVALFHDVLITLGIFSVLGLTLGVEVDSLFVVALLTIIGFSVNDTVVIYDRIRETQGREPERPINEVVDEAVNQTLGRSINTTLTTELSLVAIFLFGGATLKYFALALIVGFTAGAYSSIFVASTLLAWWRSRFPQPMPVPAEVPANADETN